MREECLQSNQPQTGEISVLLIQSFMNYILNNRRRFRAFYQFRYKRFMKCGFEVEKNLELNYQVTAKEVCATYLISSRIWCHYYFFYYF